MKTLFLALSLSFTLGAYASVETATLTCKADKASRLTAIGEASLIIDSESNKASILFGKLDLFKHNGLFYVKTSSNTINNEDPKNEAPTFEGVVDFGNDSTWGDFKTAYSPKFDTLNLECSTNAYTKTTFVTKKGNEYSMLCTCPVSE